MKTIYKNTDKFKRNPYSGCVTLGHWYYREWDSGTLYSKNEGCAQQNGKASGNNDLIFVYEIMHCINPTGIPLEAKNLSKHS